MIEQTEKRSIAEVIMQGDGMYDDLISVDKLSDGTYLVSEKQKLFGPWEGFARVHRLTPEKDTILNGAYCSYQSCELEEKTFRRLVDIMMGN